MTGEIALGLPHRRRHQLGWELVERNFQLPDYGLGHTLHAVHVDDYRSPEEEVVGPSILPDRCGTELTTA